MNNIIKTYWKAFIAVLYPKICMGCEQPMVSGEVCVCTECLYQLQHTNYHLLKENPVAQLFYGRIEVEFASSHFGFDKGGTLQKMMHQLKYKNRPDVGIYLGQHLGVGLKDSPHLPHVDYIIPVPIHNKRMKERGYNQSEYIAQGISSIMKAPVSSDTLKRINFTESQTKLSKQKRWDNVANNFKVFDNEKLEGKHVLLVDDVLTTGATIEACHLALMAVKDIKISITTVARAN